MVLIHNLPFIIRSANNKFKKQLNDIETMYLNVFVLLFSLTIHFAQDSKVLKVLYLCILYLICLNIQML